MPQTRRIALALALFVPGIASAQELLGRADETFTTTKMIGASGTVRIYSVTGDIAITEGTAGRVLYRGEKLLRRGDAEDIAFVVVQGENSLTICAVYDEDDECTERGVRSRSRRGGWWGNRASVRVTVEVPRGIALRTSSGNGDVSVRAGVRSVDVSSGNGDVQVSDAAGPVRASSGNGEITVNTTTGPVSANSGNGAVRVHMDRVAGDGDMELSSGNGEISLTVPTDFDADVSASTGNGTIRTDLPIRLSGSLSKQRMNGVIGDGGRRVQLRSGNGSIEIRRGS
ncbi:MAG: DUF4097 domain-containing protein [Gemmatimonadaceae bacterium]|jgi:DUF4097 and DUF4098 domain-containing protein YvlB|nr:DUF4097 domain-containing protein [Gemmatimonadaceae bacterium]